MSFLFLFLDGVGLGANDPSTNPFALAEMPHLVDLLGGRRMVGDSNLRLETPRASLVALDACMGVDGAPQSATGQASLLTGLNIPAQIGYHYGPKPDAAVSQSINNGNLFSQLSHAGYHTCLLNAYPPRYFEWIKSGRRLPGAIAQAARSAGLALMTADDLYAGRGFSADFTGEGWREHLGYKDAPLYSAWQAGERLAEQARSYDFSMFEFWPSDVAGHRQDMAQAVSLLESFDQVLGGLFTTWQDEHDVILITSDHGNLEDLSTRRHTRNPVPCLVIGSQKNRRTLINSLVDLSGVTPAIIEIITCQ